MPWVLRDISEIPGNASAGITGSYKLDFFCNETDQSCWPVRSVPARLEICSSCSQAAVEALIEAFPEADWNRKFHDLAAQVAGLGASHRGTVEVIRLLGGQNPRAQTLRSHTVAHLLPKLLLTKVKTKMAVSEARLPYCCNAESFESACCCIHAFHGISETF